MAALAYSDLLWLAIDALTTLSIFSGSISARAFSWSLFSSPMMPFMMDVMRAVISGVGVWALESVFVDLSSFSVLVVALPDILFSRG